MKRIIVAVLTPHHFFWADSGWFWFVLSARPSAHTTIILVTSTWNDTGITSPNRTRLQHTGVTEQRGGTLALCALHCAHFGNLGGGSPAVGQGIHGLNF